ncbi:AbrB family transcriptional regulator [Peribacillus kribbensis]|uniref:AbrB family transcriptional regulator n=1 Tax=Peribacillus kribbensis TaxID=356658 RepID=UPI0004177FE7|nr:AbrB family transcriptional regulator [Peribacillus kribbensis]
MQNLKLMLQNVPLLTITSLGGLLLYTTGISIAWLLGSLFTASIISLFLKPGGKASRTNKGIHPYWRQIGQAILGIQLGQNLHFSSLNIFEDHFILISLMLLMSIAVALLSGMMLWHFSKASMITCLFGTTPGGMSAMPAIAEEAGANALVVSLIQTIRILFVIGTVPFIAGKVNNQLHINLPGSNHSYLEFFPLLWTFLLIIGSIIGVEMGKRLKLPAPWLVGSMIGASISQLFITYFYMNDASPFWPHIIVILAQVMIGASIGFQVKKEMFRGLGRIIYGGLATSFLMVTIMGSCSIWISKITQIPLVTCILAFAPGGIAEMASTSMALNADSTFVVTVQSLRLIAVLIIMPAMLKFISLQAPIKTDQ